MPVNSVDFPSTPKSTFLKTSLPSTNSKNFGNVKTSLLRRKPSSTSLFPGYNLSSSFSTPRTSTYGRTLIESKRRTIGHSSLLAQSSMPFSNKHQDTYSLVQQPLQLKPQKTLSEIVTDYFRLLYPSLMASFFLSFRHQHAQCEKPIVTCPPFSFCL